MQTYIYSEDPAINAGWEAHHTCWEAGEAAGTDEDVLVKQAEKAYQNAVRAAREEFKAKEPLFCFSCWKEIEHAYYATCQSCYVQHGYCKPCWEAISSSTHVCCTGQE